MSIDRLTVPNAATPLDLLLYRTYGREVPGLVEQTLAQNPGLAALGVFPPAGTVVAVTTPAQQTAPSGPPVVQLYE